MSIDGDGATSLFQRKCEAVQQYALRHVCDSGELGFPWFSDDLPLYATAHQMMLGATAVLLTLLFCFGYRRGALVPSGLSNLLEFFVQFIRDEIAVRFLGEKDGRRFTPLFCSLFFFILAMNLLSLIPGMPAATANVNVTGALAAITLGFMLFGGMARTGFFGFFKGLVPEGIPWPIRLMLAPVELLSVFSKTFTLMIRLFANLFAGHMVLLLVIGMSFILGLWTTPLIVLVGALIYVIELGIAFLQAYIFTLLSAIFIAERLQPGH